MPRPSKLPLKSYNVWRKLTPLEDGFLRRAYTGPIDFKGQRWFPIKALRPANASWTHSYGVTFVNEDKTDYLSHGFDYVRLVKILLNRIRLARKAVYGIDRPYPYYHG